MAAACTLAACSGGGGSSDSQPPPPPPVSNITRAEAFRFLNQATFGATDASAQQVISQGYEAWIDGQLAQSASTQLGDVLAAYVATPPPVMDFQQFHRDRVISWYDNSITAPDQLRQRVAFALSEIMVVSEQSLGRYPFAVADYYDMLARNAFGDFRQLIEQVTLHPAMGVYLSMLGNQRPDTALNIRPDENHARELMQLFTIGLVELNLDGSVRRDGQNQPIPTYDQATIEGFAHVFTGWSWAGGQNFQRARASIENQSLPMQAYAEQHDAGAKRVLSYPGAALTTISAGQTPARDLADALDNIVGHPNVAPFISKQLIQRLVTSNPSPQYVERVAQRFNNDGAGRRGNLGAVLKAILLDTEAREASSSPNAGKVKEPLLRVTQLWRAYNARSASGLFFIRDGNFVLGQGPLQAPSVFNFFSPFHAPPGEIADANLVAPELQIATEYLNTNTTNFVFATAFCYVPTPVQGCGAPGRDTPILDTSIENSLANNPDALVDKIADRLLAGQISTVLRDEARAMVERAPANLPSLRTAEALYLIASSPEFAYQK